MCKLETVCKANVRTESTESIVRASKFSILIDYEIICLKTLFVFEIFICNTLFLFFI